MPTNYSKSPNETIDQYNARIGMSKTTSAARDAYFQSLANVNPEAANNAMDIVGYGYAPAGSITSSTFAPVPGVQYQNPAPISSYPVGTLISQPLSAPEQNASDLTKQIQDLNTSLAGKDAYALQQQQNYGVADLQKQLDEYNSKITGLANQSQSLDVQANYTVPNQMQLNSEGRGITAGGLAPIQASELRKIQIQKGSIASDALTTKAAADAVQGKLTSALYYADLAVKQKYAGQEGELKAKMANLDLILKSPEYTKAQKDRADQQQQLLKQQQDSLDTQKENQKTIQGLALQALQNGAPPVVVDQIMKANDLSSAFQAAQGYAAKETATSIQEYQFAVKNGYKGSYTQYQDEDARRAKSVAAAGAGAGLSGTPNSYKEWQLAGGEAGTGKTYSQFLSDSNTKAPTTAQQTVATYAARIEQSNPTIDSLSQFVSTMNPVTFEAQTRLPSYLQSPKYRQFDQAARNFINSVLRRESGAVISPSEFDNAYRQYLPRAGDDAATLAQKQKNREIVFASLRNAAGGAYQGVDQLLGTAPSAPQTFTSPTGKTYKLPN